MVKTRLMTAEDLEAMGSNAGKRFELFDGEDVLPGFRLPLSDLFRAPRGLLEE